MASNPIIDQLEKEQIRTDIPEFNPGDTVRVEVKVVEGDKSRLQAFEGNVIAKRNRGVIPVLVIVTLLSLFVRFHQAKVLSVYSRPTHHLLLQLK